MHAQQRLCYDCHGMVSLKALLYGQQIVFEVLKPVKLAGDQKSAGIGLLISNDFGRRYT